MNIAADIGAAIAMERKSSRVGPKTPLKDLLKKCVASYNRMVTVKKHKIDSAKWALIYNLCFGSHHCLGDSCGFLVNGRLMEKGVYFVLGLRLATIGCEPLQSCLHYCMRTMTGSNMSAQARMWEIS